MISNETKIRVRYADTDKMRFVYNGKYLEYFEVGRTELLRNFGMPYREIEEHGFQLPLIEAFVKYHNAGRYDDLLTVIAKIEEPVSPKLKIEYEIFRNEGTELVASGYTLHTFMNAETQRASRPPKFYIEKIEQIEQITDKK